MNETEAKARIQTANYRAMKIDFYPPSAFPTLLNVKNIRTSTHTRTERGRKRENGSPLKKACHTRHRKRKNKKLAYLLKNTVYLQA